MSPHAGGGLAEGHNAGRRCALGRDDVVGVVHGPQIVVILMHLHNT